MNIYTNFGFEEWQVYPQIFKMEFLEKGAHIMWDVVSRFIECNSVVNKTLAEKIKKSFSYESSRHRDGPKE